MHDSQLAVLVFIVERNLVEISTVMIVMFYSHLRAIYGHYVET